MHTIFKSYFIMKANSIDADQTAPSGSSLIWVHVLCNIGYESTPVDEKADDIYYKWRENGENDTNLKVLLFL